MVDGRAARLLKRHFGIAERHLQPNSVERSRELDRDASRVDLDERFPSMPRSSPSILAPNRSERTPVDGASSGLFAAGPQPKPSWRSRALPVYRGDLLSSRSPVAGFSTPAACKRHRSSIASRVASERTSCQVPPTWQAGVWCEHLPGRLVATPAFAARAFP
jgi:hypothetical protein